MAKTNRTNVVLYPSQPQHIDSGLSYAAWRTLYCTRVDIIARVLTLNTTGRISEIPGLGLPPASEDVFMAVINGKWSAIKLSDYQLPNPAALDSGMLMHVVDGNWRVDQPPYILPTPEPEGAWLTAIDSKWRGFIADASALPEIDRAEDANKVLTVAGGVWDKGNVNNFYLPWPDAITPEVPHAATVSGAQWLKRPLTTASVARRGTLPKIPGDESLVFHGDGQWRDLRGDDYGHWRIGDVRRAGAFSGDGWLPLAGGTIGRLDNADYNGVRYHALYMRLHPNAEDWEAGIRVVLEDRAGYEILAVQAALYPAVISVFTGPSADGPYLLQFSSSPDFTEILFASGSDSDSARWSELDGVLVCSTGGATCETHTRHAELVTPPAALGTGFFHTRYRPSAGGAWVYGSAWVTEEDVLRLDTVVAAGSAASGIMPRPPPFRMQIPVINGRPVHTSFAKRTSEAYGVTLSTDTSRMDGGWKVHRPRDGGAQTGYRDPARHDMFAGVEMQLYGTGDMAAERTYTTSPDMQPILEQLTALDGYTADAPPKFKLVRLEYGVENRKWWGGVVGADGNIYLIPHFAQSVLVIEPKTGRMHEIGNYFGSRGKWSGGVLAPDGKLYCFPFNESRFLVVDTNTRKATTSTLGLKDTDVFKSNSWAGGCLNFDGTIRAFPTTGTHELVIDWARQTVEAYNTSFAMMEWAETKSQVKVTSKYEHPYLWYRDVALHHNTIATPWCGADTVYGGAVMGAAGVVRAVPCGNYLLEQLRLGFNEKFMPGFPYKPLLSWSLAERDWKDYATPTMCGTATAASVSRFVEYDMYDRSNNGGPDQYVGGLGRGGDFEYNRRVAQGRTKYLGGVLAPDGNNYFIPCGGAPDVLVAPPMPENRTRKDYPSASFRVNDPRYANCRGGVLGPDGGIYSASADGTAAFILTPRTRQVRVLELPHPKMRATCSAWMGAVTGPDGWVYFVPHDSEYLLVVDPCVPAGPWPAEMNQYLNKF